MEMTPYDKAAAAFDKAAGHRATEASILTTFNVGCELLRLRARIEVLERERDEARAALAWSQANPSEQQVGDIAARLAALEPVVEAAKVWRPEKCCYGDNEYGAPCPECVALRAAVDALRAGEGK